MSSKRGGKAGGSAAPTVVPPPPTSSSSSSSSSDSSSADAPVRVYVDGIYDLFHFGHARSLEQAKKLFPNTYLMVGVCNDELTHRHKGKTVMTDKERYESVRHCRWVDEVVEDAPWVVNQEFLDKHRIKYVAHGEDMCYDENGKDVYEFVKSKGHFRTIKRTDGISTSDIIIKIVKDYDKYVKRNLKRGYKAEDMNVPYLKAKRFQMEAKVSDAVDKIANIQPIKEWVRGFGETWDRLKHHFDPTLSPGRRSSIVSLSGSNSDYSDNERDLDDEEEDEEGDEEAPTLQFRTSSRSSTASAASDSEGDDDDEESGNNKKGKGKRARR